MSLRQIRSRSTVTFSLISAIVWMIAGQVASAASPAGCDVGCDVSGCDDLASCACQGCGTNVLDRWLANLKGIPIGNCGTLDVGGNYRARFHRENNIRPGSTGGLSGVDDHFWLHQTRLWFDGTWSEDLSFRIGFIDASSTGEQFPNRAREVNQHDLYQAHINAVLRESRDSKLTARLGRQEARLGSARLVMAPNWANRRRTHDGARFFWEKNDWVIEPMWLRPVDRDRASFRKFDEPNEDQQIYGVFSTYNGFEDDQLEVYWLAYDVLVPEGNARYDTLGSRLLGSHDGWVYEFEAGLQLGENPDDTDHTAGFFTGGVGRTCETPLGDAELIFYYDWASGDDTRGNGFHSYVQRAHYYLGFMDLYGRRNIEDFNLRLTLNPTKKIAFVTWLHFFYLANGNDVPYNVNLRPYANLPSGSAGSQTLGRELDFLLTFDFDEQSQVRFGYSYFWPGTFYDTTPGVPANMEASFFYCHFLRRW